MDVRSSLLVVEKLRLTSRVKLLPAFLPNHPAIAQERLAFARPDVATIRPEVALLSLKIVQIQHYLTTPSRRYFQLQNPHYLPA